MVIDISEGFKINFSDTFSEEALNNETLEHKNINDSFSLEDETFEETVEESSENEQEDDETNNSEDESGSDDNSEGEDEFDEENLGDFDGDEESEDGDDDSEGDEFGGDSSDSSSEDEENEKTNITTNSFSVLNGRRLILDMMSELITHIDKTIEELRASSVIRETDSFSKLITLRSYVDGAMNNAYICTNEESLLKYNIQLKHYENIISSLSKITSKK